MASVALKETKAGKKYYLISFSRGHDTSKLTKRWYPPQGWSERAIQSKLKTVVAQFEQECRSGAVLSRAEQKEKEQIEKAEELKIQSVRSYCEKVFMPAKAITVTENSRYSFQSNIDKYILPAIGDMKMPDVTSAELTALLLNMQQNGLKNASCVKVFVILNLIFKMAYKSDLIDRNPMDKVDRPRPLKSEKQDKAEVRYYTESELQYIQKCALSEPLKWQVYINLSIETGCRRGELCGLLWKNINSKTGSILIDGSLNYSPDKGVYRAETKSGLSRTVYVSSEMLQLLNKYEEALDNEIKERMKKEEKGNKPIAFSKVCKSEYVFTEINSFEPMHPQSPTRYFKKFGRKYNVPDFHPHLLRHSFASVAIANGAPVSAVSEVLGHSDSAVTLRMYTHADEEAQRKASEIFRSALKANSI